MSQSIVLLLSFNTVPVKCKLTVTRNSILDPRYSSIEDRGSRIEYRVSSFEHRESSFEYRASSFKSSGSTFEKRKQRTYRSINCSNQIKKNFASLINFEALYCTFVYLQLAMASIIEQRRPQLSFRKILSWEEF